MPLCRVLTSDYMALQRQLKKITVLGKRSGRQLGAAGGLTAGFLPSSVAIHNRYEIIFSLDVISLGHFHTFIKNNILIITSRGEKRDT